MEDEERERDDESTTRGGMVIAIAATAIASIIGLLIGLFLLALILGDFWPISR